MFFITLAMVVAIVLAVLYGLIFALPAYMSGKDIDTNAGFEFIKSIKDAISYRPCQHSFTEWEQKADKQSRVCKKCNKKEVTTVEVK